MLILFGCSKEQPNNYFADIIVSSKRLRSDFEASEILLAGYEKSGKSWSSRGQVRNGKWLFDRTINLRYGDKVFAFSPTVTLEKGSNAVLFSTKHGTDYLFSKNTFDGGPLRIKFSPLLSKVRLEVVFEDIRIIEKNLHATIKGASTTGYYDLKEDRFHKVREEENLSVQLESSDNRIFRGSFSLIPGYAESLLLEIMVNESTYTVVLPTITPKSGEEETYRVLATPFEMPYILTKEEVRLRTDDPIIMSDKNLNVRVTPSSTKWKVLPRGCAVPLSFFFYNDNSEEKTFDVRYIIEDHNGNLCHVSPYWSDFKIKANHFEGLYLPFYTNLTEGEYRLSILLRNNGEDKWNKLTLIDEESDWDIHIEDSSGVSISSFSLVEGAASMSDSSIQELKVDQEYKAKIGYYNYSLGSRSGVLRIYYERDPKGSGHSSYKDEDGKIYYWRDKIFEKEVTFVSGRGFLLLDYQIPLRGSDKIRKHIPYIYATLEIDGKESLLYADVNYIFHKSLPIKSLSSEGINMTGLFNRYNNTSTPHIIERL